MGSLYIPDVVIQIKPPPPSGTQVSVGVSATRLADIGLNFPVTVMSPREGAAEDGAFPVTVNAHLDTGASITAIDVGLANHLKLIPTGISDIMTAGGLRELPNYVVDLLFPGSTLTPFVNIPIGSCYLGFDVNGDLSSSRNFALLIGRDIMSRWSIFWNGPASSVMIND